MNYNISKDFAINLDANDNLRSYQEKFYFPLKKNGEKHIYLCGNSLGLQSKNTNDFIQQELEDWKNLGVEGHLHARNPWLPYHEFLSESYSKIVGAKKSEVVAMNTLSVNLHLMMVSFYLPTKKRFKVIMEADAFPSDIYAIESHIKHHNINPSQAIIRLKPRENESNIRTKDLKKIIDNNGDEIALIILGGVNYYTGQVFDMQEITKLGHDKGIKVGFDLAHAVGNISLSLHNWNVDFAAWCSYKYLCSGPGAPSGIFIHEKHHEWDGPRLQGWWGNDKATRFKMNRDFNPINSAEGWQISNAPILGMAPLIASMELFDRAGMDLIYNKGQNLSNYLYYLINEIFPEINIITPKDHGCQLSLVVENGRSVFNNLSDRGVVCDWREPDVIRFAPHPLFNSYLEIFDLVKFLKESINGSK